MAISFIGAATGGSTATMPAHQTGDLILTYVFRTGSTSFPSIPAGWSVLHASPGANSCVDVVAGKFAASSAEVVGSWTNASALIVQIYRGAAGTGAIDGAAGNSSNILYPGLSLQNESGSSWVVRFCGHSSVGQVTSVSVPAGYTQRAASSNARGIDRANLTASFVGSTASSGTGSGGWQAASLELLAAADATTDTTSFFQFF